MSNTTRILVTALIVTSLGNNLAAGANRVEPVHRTRSPRSPIDVPAHAY